MKRLLLLAGIILALITTVASNSPVHAHVTGGDCKVPIIVSCCN